MDFFHYQQEARKNSVRLVILFIMGIMATVASCYFLAVFAIAYAQFGPNFQAADLWDPVVLIWVTLFTCIIVGLGSGYKIALLKGGGSIVAEELGGRLLKTNTTDLTERKILNVVEEVSLASGVPMPPVYIMDKEEGINAFAAGYTAQDAVISVTRGCVEQLSRDELQGVIAHEFSHILNGDMRLSTRLIGFVFGLMVIGLMGYYALRLSPIRSSNEDRNGAFVIVIGIGLIIIGALGTLFGNLIKAAVSRQRELLADASAVQFTRNPEGIGGALKKIAGWPAGSLMRTPRAKEASHMFFSEGVAGFFETMFASHPPITERIRRIYGEGVEIPSSVEGGGWALHPAGAAGFVPSIGTVSEKYVESARDQIAQLPEEVRDASRSPEDAAGLILSLLDKNSALNKKFSLPEKLLLIRMVIPAITRLDLKDYIPFKAHVQELASSESGNWVSWFILKSLELHADTRYYPTGPKAIPMRRLNDFKREENIVLSSLEIAGRDNPEEVSIDFNVLDEALRALDRVNPADKRSFLQSCLAAISAGGKITIEEAELLRLVADAIHCPSPVPISKG